MKKAKIYVKQALRLFLVFLLLAALFAYSMFQGGFVSWFLFYSFLPFALYSLLLAFYPVNAFRVERQFKERRYQAGESLKVVIEIKRKFPFPLYFLFVEDLLPKELRQSQLSMGKTILFPGFKRHFTFEYDINPLIRGLHEFQGIRLKTGDFLGLVEKEIQYPMEKEILVYPHYQEIKYRQIENKFAHGTVSSRLMHQRDTTMAVGVREYMPGDKFSWINWKATARKNKIMTKEFEHKQSYDVLMLLNRSNGSLNQMLFEKSVSFAATAARAILREDSKLGFISAGRERTVIQMNNGKQQQEKIFYHLATVKSDSPVPFSQVLEQEVRRWPTGITILLVTHELTRDLVQAIESLSYRNHSIVLYFLTYKSRTNGDTHKAIDRLRMQHVVVKVIDTDHFEDAFNGVSLS